MSRRRRRRPRHRLPHRRTAAGRLRFSRSCGRRRLGRGSGAFRSRGRGLALWLRVGLLRALTVAGLGVLARLQIASAIAVMRRVLLVAIAAAMTTTTAPAAPAPAASIVLSAFATVLTVLRRLLGRLLVLRGVRLLSGLLA
jgi:hypothetical protein